MLELMVIYLHLEKPLVLLTPLHTHLSVGVGRGTWSAQDSLRMGDLVKPYQHALQVASSGDMHRITAGNLSVIATGEALAAFYSFRGTPRIPLKREIHFNLMDLSNVTINMIR